MWKLKGCPRCNGDLYIDPFDNSENCLQCGDVLNVPIRQKQQPQPHGKDCGRHYYDKVLVKV